MSNKLFFLMSPVVICLSFLALGELIHLTKVLFAGVKERMRAEGSGRFRGSKQSR